MNIPTDPHTTTTKVACPYCRSTQTELFSLFGQQLLIVHYYCQSCHTPFEAVKDDSMLANQGVAHIARGAENAATHRDHHDDVHFDGKDKRS
jgi:sarcosine oxidase delta subunit